MSIETSNIINKGYLTLMTSGSIIDILVHHGERSNFPPIIAEHIGNFGPTLMGAFLTAFYGKLIQEYSIRHSRQKLEKVGKVIKESSPLMWIAINAIYETSSYNLTEYIGDVALGSLAALTFFVVWNNLENNLENRKNNQFIQIEEQFVI